VLSLSQQIRYIVGNHLFMLGPLGLIAVILLLMRRPANGVLLLSCLAAPWIVWTAVMRTHIAFHNFELLIAAPLTALALAWIATAGLRIRWSGGAALRAAAFVACAALVLLLPRPMAEGDRNPEGRIRYALDLRSATATGSVVLAPTLSAVPLYYSERHIIRGIANGDALSAQLQDIRKEFPTSQLYLAVPPSLASDFAQALSHATVVSSTPDAIVAKL
jgi:hypothetical protein